MSCDIIVFVRIQGHRIAVSTLVSCPEDCGFYSRSGHWLLCPSILEVITVWRAKYGDHSWPHPFASFTAKKSDIWCLKFVVKQTRHQLFQSRKRNSLEVVSHKIVVAVNLIRIIWNPTTVLNSVSVIVYLLDWRGLWGLWGLCTYKREEKFMPSFGGIAWMEQPNWKT